MTHPARRTGCFLLGAIAIGVAAPQTATPAGGKTAAQIAQPIDEKYHVDITKIFATSCSWCHDAFGMKAGKGPKLAGTAKTREQVIDQISNGEPGYMPAFKAVLKKEQIQAMAEYVKTLPAN